MTKMVSLFGKSDFKRFVVEQLVQVRIDLAAILGKEGQIMAKVEDLQAKLDAIPPVLDAIVADEQAQRDEIQALKDQLAQGTPVSQEQLDSLDAKAGAILERLQGIDASV